MYKINKITKVTALYKFKQASGHKRLFEFLSPYPRKLV